MASVRVYCRVMIAGRDILVTPENVTFNPILRTRTNQSGMWVIINSESTVTITITCNSNYVFTSTPTVAIEDYNGKAIDTTVSLDANSQVLTISFQNGVVADNTTASDINISSIPIKEIAQETFNVRVLFPDNVLPSNITFSPALSEYNGGYIFTVNQNTVQTVTLSASSGYYFPRIPTLELTDYGGIAVEIIDPVLSSNATTFTFSFNTGNTLDRNQAEQLEYLTLEVVQVVPTPTGIGAFITYYKVNDDILNQLSQVLIYQLSGEIINLSNYIASLRSYPFDIASSDPISIILGYANTNVKAPVANAVFHELDFGTVTLAPTNNNVNDYSVEIKAMLPYIGYVNLDAANYAGQTIRLEYDVDIRTGLFSATFYVNNEIPLDIFTGKIGSDIPFKTTGNDLVSNLTSFLNTSIQETYPLQASILTIWHDNMASRGVISTYETIGAINDLTDTGLTTFTDINLIGNIPNELKTEIIRMLESGIFI